jgi:polar amino acid transport system substrate-binding protein
MDTDRYQIGVNNFAMNESRKEKYIYSDPIFKTYDIVAFSPTSKFSSDKITSFRDLSGLSTINAPGNNAATILENYNTDNPDAKINLNYSDGDVVLQVQEVQEGKYDFILLDKPLYDQYAAEYNLTLRAVELSDKLIADVSKVPYTYLLITKGHEQLASEINAALKELINDGTSKAINLKYFGSDYTPYD